MGDASTFVTPKSDVSLSAAEHAAAGSVAKAATKLILYPLDTWKSRRQARRFGDVGEFRHLQGFRGVYRGVVPKLLLYSPYQAVYMSAYVTARDKLLQGPRPFGDSPLSFVAAGMLAEVAGAAIRLPMEVSKLRLQLGAYRNTWHAFKDLMMNPGQLMRGFVPQTLMHDCSYSACGWFIFESGRQWLFSMRGTSNLPVHENLLLGFGTGTLTALVTNPLDVIKTRIIGSVSQPPPGILSTAQSIWRLEGVLAFWQGATLRVLHLAPSHGLYMLLYEVIKLQLSALHWAPTESYRIPGQLPRHEQVAMAETSGLSLQTLKDAQHSGTKVEAHSQAYVDGLWYEVKILELEAQRAKVHYVGFGNDEDEWLPFTHFRLQESRSELSSEVTVLRKQVESMSERFQLSAEQAQMKQAVADLQKQVESLQHQVDSITQKLTLNPEEPAKATVASAKATATPDPSDPGGPKTAVLEAPDAAAALQQQMLSLTEQVDLSKTQTEQVASMVERLAETMQKQALDASNMEQAFVRSESKIIGLQASSVSVLEGRLRVFVKTELDHTVLAAMEDCNVMQRLDVVENLQQQRVAAVEEETQWLREVVEVLSESVGFDLVPRDGTRRSSAARAKSRDLASPEGRNAALFDQLDTNGDDEVNLQEFQAAQVATGQRKVDLFDELDSNLDGRVTREEFAAVTVDARPRFGHGPRKPSSRPHEELEMSMDNQWMGEDALIGAVLAEDSERALTLLRTADVTVRDKEGCTALHRASALPGLARVRRALLEKGGARLASMRDLHMRTPLHHAALAGCLEACQQLLDAASFHDADRRALHGRTALHLAAEYGRAEVCRCLLDHPKFTVVDAADDYGHTGLHHAAMQGHAAVCQALLEHPRFIGEGAKDKEGWTAFHWAASGGFATVCRILLASPSFAEVATRTARGWTALHLAAAHGLEEVVHVLLKHPRFKVVTAQDCVGRNALHAAAEAGHRNVCKLLMAHENFRVLATTKDYGGNRASDLATGAALEVPLH